MSKITSLAICLLMSAVTFGQSSGGDQEWRSYGHDPGGMRHSPFDQINGSNVARLERAWTYHTGEVDPKATNTEEHRVASIECTPLVVDGPSGD